MADPGLSFNIPSIVSGATDATQSSTPAVNVAIPYAQPARSVRPRLIVTPDQMQELDSLAAAQRRRDENAGQRRGSAPAIETIGQARSTLREDPLFRMTPLTRFRPGASRRSASYDQAEQSAHRHRAQPEDLSDLFRSYGTGSEAYPYDEDETDVQEEWEDYDIEGYDMPTGPSGS